MPEMETLDARKIKGKTVDDTAIADGKALTYVAASGNIEYITPSGAGDMTKAVYDTDNDSVVDNSEKLEGSTKAQVQAHAPQAHESSHISGGSDPFLSTDLLEAISKRLQESSGPTTLTLGAVADGQYLQRSGANIVGAAGAGGGIGFVFGGNPQSAFNYGWAYGNQKHNPFARTGTSGSFNGAPIPKAVTAKKVTVNITVNTLNQDAQFRLYNATTSTGSAEGTITAGTTGMFTVTTSLTINENDLVYCEVRTNGATSGAITWWDWSVYAE